MTTPFADRLIETLESVQDLDVLQQTYSNEQGDKRCPWLAQWVVELCNAERARRDGPSDEATDFRIVDTAELPLDGLCEATSYSLSVYRLTENLRTPDGASLPTVAEFAWAMVHVLFAESVLRLKTAQNLGAPVG